MQSNYSECINKILEHEGGYVNHPSDPGGATNYGITIGTLSQYRNRRVSITDVKRLTLDEAEDIYKVNYWDACRCDELPIGLDLAVFDCAVNQGVRRSTRLLQKSVKTKVDGVIGPNTLKAIWDSGRISLLVEFQARRMRHYGNLRTFKTFGLGWSRRLMNTMAVATEMAIDDIS